MVLGWPIYQIRVFLDPGAMMPSLCLSTCGRCTVVFLACFVYSCFLICVDVHLLTSILCQLFDCFNCSSRSRGISPWSLCWHVCLLRLADGVSGASSFLPSSGLGPVPGFLAALCWCLGLTWSISWHDCCSSSWRRYGLCRYP